MLPWGPPQPWWHDISWRPWVGGQDLNCNNQFLVKAPSGHKLPWVQVADRPAHCLEN